MKVTHLQSSTQIIDLDGVKVLTDPWLTEGEYYGSWYHYPPFGEENISNIEYDYIYVSHIHPDHLSEKTFRALPHKKPVLINNYDSKFVKRKLEMLGFQVIECNNGIPFDFGKGRSITIYAADNCNPEICGRFMGCGHVEKLFGVTSIDSLALFRTPQAIILNTNDCPYELASYTIKANNLDKMKIDLLLVGYAGAGSFPQCFEFENEQDKLQAAETKKLQFLKKAENYINLLRPVTFAPFAGTYILGSRLAPLSEYRGVPSVNAAIDYLNNAIEGASKGIYLQKFDSYECSTRTLNKFNEKCRRSYEEYKSEIAQKPLDYDNDAWDDDELEDLIESAYSRFIVRAEQIGFKSDTQVMICTQRIAFKFSVYNKAEVIQNNCSIAEPYLKIDVDHNLLHRLLRGPRYAHWNNAEIGSHLKYVRKSAVHERGLHHCLCFFHL